MKKYILLLLAIGLLSGCGEKRNNDVKPPIRVKTQLASLRTSDDAMTYVGIVEENEATAVSFTSMGMVRRVLVGEGQAVGRGQLIAEMDDTQARNLLAGAEAQMAQANDALERYRLLHEAGSLPEVQWVEIQSKVAQAKSQLEVAKKNLADCRLTAPVGGIIGKKMVKTGETALPSQAIVTILDISSVKVKVAVPESEVDAIGANTASRISIEAVGKEMDGGRIEKGVAADALTHTYDVRIHVQNADRKLLPGMVASVRFKASPSPSQGGNVLLPVTAVQRASDGSLFVWMVDNDNTSHRVKVSIGSTIGNSIVITDGVESGQRIVTEGYQKLSENTHIIY